MMKEGVALTDSARGAVLPPTANDNKERRSQATLPKGMEIELGIPSGGKRRTVLVIYVGGTIGMCLNEHGALAPKKGFLREELLTMSDFKLPGMPKFEVIEYEKLVDSSDASPVDWVKMARDVHDNYFSYDGFLIAHGTDTMHYTASALSFMLSNLGKPIIITGAMIPLVEPYNDARRNLIISMMFAAHPDICEVCIYFNDVLLRGNRAKKASMTVSAFASPSYPPLARIGGHDFKVDKKLLLLHPTGPFAVHSNMRAAILYFTVTPDFDFAALTAFVANPANICQGIILELCGVGSSTSTLIVSLQELLSLAERSGVLVACTSQTISGGLPSRDVQRLKRLCPRLVRLGDMTAEAAVVKAMYLFGRGLSLQAVKKWMVVNLRGELQQEVLHANL